jgi:hypothetical protein
VLTNGLVVTNMTGVTIVSVSTSLPVSKVIDASAGKVIFGNADHSTTIEKGTLTSNTTDAVTVAADGVIAVPYSADGATFTLAPGGSIEFKGANAKLTSGSVALSGGKFTNGAAALTLTSTDAATTTSLTGTALTRLLLGAGAKLDVPAATSVGLTLKGVVVDLSENGQITIGNAGKILLGATSANAENAAGIVTKYSGTDTAVVAGGHATTTLATAANVTAFGNKVDYAAVVAGIGTGISIQGTITGGNPANNTIDKNDTFTVSTPAISVVAAP